MKLTKNQHDILIKWVSDNLIPLPKTNYNIDTSEIRQSFCDLFAYGFYIDNYTMNDVLKECGYIPAMLSHDPYFRWNISSKSRAIQKYRSSLGVPSKAPKYE